MDEKDEEEREYLRMKAGEDGSWGGSQVFIAGLTLIIRLTTVSGETSH